MPVPYRFIHVAAAVTRNQLLDDCEPAFVVVRVLDANLAQAARQTIEMFFE